MKTFLLLIIIVINIFQTCSFRLRSLKSIQIIRSTRYEPFRMIIDDTQERSEEVIIEDDELPQIDDILQLTINQTSVNETLTDSNAEYIQLKVEMLNSQIQQIESFIATERINLVRIKDKISESGKNGYFIVQAQVADFMV